MSAAAGDITVLLDQVEGGDQRALSALMERVYPELKRIAGRCLRAERGDHTLQPTALVNEAYLRLVKQRQSGWQNRLHFFSIAATLMRRILVDYARAKKSGKRAIPGQAVEASDYVASAIRVDPADLLAIDEALQRLEERDPRQARVVELRYYAGLNEEEIGQLLGIAEITVRRDWRSARAFLRRALGPADSTHDSRKMAAGQDPL